MKLIPVIDLKHGQVVAARRGDRHTYAPLVSPLCPSSTLPDVAAALLDLYAFDTLYIADLDAIGGDAGHLDQIAALHRAYPRIALWVDNGLQTLDRLTEIARPVLGSESLDSSERLSELCERIPEPILSLDYRDGQLLGPPVLERQPARWPETVILMTLERVGGDGGPDLERLRQLRHIAPDHPLYAAGGVRDASDLERLRTLGVAGALIATALHRGTITPSTIAAFAASSDMPTD